MFIAVREFPVALYEKGFRYFGTSTKMFFEHHATKNRVTVIAVGLPLGSVRFEQYDPATDSYSTSEVHGKFRSRKQMNEFLGRISQS